MAKRNINQKIEFAYVNENIEKSLKYELEKRFLYQHILIVDEHFEFGNTIDKLCHGVMCNFEVCRNIDLIKNFENFDCIVIVNDSFTNNIKTICKRYNIPYIFALTKICDSSNFKRFLYYTQNKIVECNFPLGIVFDLSTIVDWNKFLTSAILEVSSLSFEILQAKIENLFFNKKLNFENIEEKKKLIIKLQNTLDSRRDNIKEFSKKIASLYLSYCLTSAQNGFDVIDNLLDIYKRNNKTSNIIYIKQYFKTIMLSLEKNFFKYYTNKLIGTIDYKVHQKHLQYYGYELTFNIKNISNNKIGFLLDEIGKKLVEFVCSTINFEKAIKNILLEIDVDTMYDFESKCSNTKFTDYINLEPNVYQSQSFLMIMYQLGLLNFNF